MIDGYLSSSFDLLNVADLDVIDQARARCDRLTVGVFSDEYVERTLGRKPVVPLDERATLVAHVRGVDAVVLHDEVDLEALRRDAIVFAVSGVAEEAHTPPQACWLRPARRSTSEVLRRNLEPTSPETDDDRSAVA